MKRKQICASHQVLSVEAVLCPIENEVGQGMKSVGYLVARYMAQMSQYCGDNQRVLPECQDCYSPQEAVFPGVKHQQCLLAFPPNVPVEVIYSVVNIYENPSRKRNWKS